MDETTPEDVGVPPEFIPEDQSRYISEMKREALQVLFPKEGPHDAITKYSGKPPNLYKFYLATVEWEIEEAMTRPGRKIKWELVNPATFLPPNIESLGGWRSNQAVEIARATPPNGHRGILDRLLGR